MYYLTPKYKEWKYKLGEYVKLSTKLYFFNNGTIIENCKEKLINLNFRMFNFHCTF